MKKSKKEAALERRVQVVEERGNELARKLMLDVILDTKGEDSAFVALYALARTVFCVVDAQIHSGYPDAFDDFMTLLEGEVEAKMMLLNMKEKDIRTKGSKSLKV